MNPIALDSGAAQHFFKKEQESPYKIFTKIENGPNVQLPNKEMMLKPHQNQEYIEVHTREQSTHDRRIQVCMRGNMAE